MVETPTGAQMLGQWTQGNFREGYITENPQIWYFGQIEDGKFHGKGFKVQDSSTYDGYFREGALAGNGVLIDKNDRAYSGHFEDNRRHGKIVIIQDDLIVEANYIDGVKDKVRGDIQLDPESDQAKEAIESVKQAREHKAEVDNEIQTLRSVIADYERQIEQMEREYNEADPLLPVPEKKASSP